MIKKLPARQVRNITSRGRGIGWNFAKVTQTRCQRQRIFKYNPGSAKTREEWNSWSAEKKKKSEPMNYSRHDGTFFDKLLNICSWFSCTWWEIEKYENFFFNFFISKFEYFLTRIINCKIQVCFVWLISLVSKYLIGMRYIFVRYR